MLDVLLHVIGAAMMVAPTALPSTPAWLALPWAFCVAVFWFARELAQDRAKHGAFRSPGKWSAWKWAEAIAPAAIALLSGAGVTVWRAVA